MSEPDFIYFSSPWSLHGVGGFAILLFLLFVYLVRRQAIIARVGLKYYFIYLGAIFVMLSALVWVTTSFFRQDRGWRALIHRDYFACGSWSDGEYSKRVPWHHFTRINLERTGGLGIDVVLQFSLDSRYINEVPWSDWVKSHGWVNCGISGVTRDPRRFGFPTDTDTIHDQVWRAWIARLNDPRTPATYKELMDARRAMSPK